MDFRIVGVDYDIDDDLSAATSDNLRRRTVPAWPRCLSAEDTRKGCQGADQQFTVGGIGRDPNAF